MNVKTIAERRENMLWFKVPPKIYFKYGCLGPALRELSTHKRAMLVTDESLFRMGYASALAWVLFIYILVLTLIVQRSSRYWVYYEGDDRKG